jgi:hypothetical protein
MPFRLEQQIRDRLAAKVDGIAAVHGAPAGVSPDALRHPGPCLYLIFVDADPQGENDHPSKSIIRVDWQVLISVRNLTDASDGQAAREDAQAIGQSVFAAMHGWRPAGFQRPFRFAGASARLFDSGRHLVALDFSITYPIGD